MEKLRLILHGRLHFTCALTMRSCQQAEQILLNCGVHPTDAESVIKDLDVSVAKVIVTDSTDGDRWEAFSPPSPELKHTLRDCLSKQNFLYHVSGEDNSQNRYSEYTLSTVSRRYLADQPNGIMPPTLAPAPTPVLSSAASPVPLSGPAPSSVLASAPFAGPEVETPSHGPSPSNGRVPDLSPAPTAVGASLQVSEGPSPDKSAVIQPENQIKIKNTVVITAVLVTAGVTILAAFLVCCCWRCFRNTSADDGPKDGRPLLTLSTSDFSGRKCVFFFGLMWLQGKVLKSISFFGEKKW